MALRKSTKKMLQQTLLKFKFEDFFTFVLREFHQVSREEIINMVSQNRMQSSKRNIAKEITDEDSVRSIVFLQIQAVALRPECRLWIALRLIGDPIINEYTDACVESLVSRSLRRNGIESITRAFHKSSAFWINITVKKVTQKKGLVLEPPIFCVFYIENPFIFISKNNSDNIKRSVVEAFGFVDFSHCKLTDHDPKSMLKILSTKETRLEVNQWDELSDEPLKTSTGFDFSQHHKRQDYINNLFPEGTPMLSDYSVECKEAPWPTSSKFPEMGERTYPLKLQLRTKDTAGMFRAMVEEGILDVPVPSYVRRAVNCARKKIKVRADKNNCTVDETI